MKEEQEVVGESEVTPAVRREERNEFMNPISSRRLSTQPIPIPPPASSAPAIVPSGSGGAGKGGFVARKEKREERLGTSISASGAPKRNHNNPLSIPSVSSRPLVPVSLPTPARIQSTTTISSGKIPRTVIEFERDWNALVSKEQRRQFLYVRSAFPFPFPMLL